MEALVGLALVGVILSIGIGGIGNQLAEIVSELRLQREQQQRIASHTEYFYIKTKEDDDEREEYRRRQKGQMI